MSHFCAAIFGCAGPVLSPEEKAFFQEVTPFGFILFARNIVDADQLRKLSRDLRHCVPHTPPILIDQEGGRVQRLRPPMATQWLPPLDHIAQAGENAARLMYLRARITSTELMRFGIDCNCAPLIDVAHQTTHAFLQNRCYGMDANTVTSIGRAVAQGHLDGGVLPVMKHMPGHGRARLDSHFELPVVSEDRQDLEQDFAPFRALNDLPLGMTGHMVLQSLDPRPATLSPVIIDLIRNDIGFSGLLMTDDISMEALKGDVAERSRGAIAAGCDVVLHCNGKLEEMLLVADAVGTTTDLAQSRAHAALEARKPSKPVDIAALREELESL